MKRLVKAAVLALCLVMTLMSLPSEVKAETDIFLYIDEVCEQYNVSSSLVIAMAESESSLHYPEADNLWKSAKAKNGTCTGLLQVSAKWHKARMEKLGATDLTDPYDNILVAVDYLAELFEELEDDALVLETYNGDSRIWKTYESGWMSEYATTILERAAELDEERFGGPYGK